MLYIKHNIQYLQQNNLNILFFVHLTGFYLAGWLANCINICWLNTEARGLC
jgi:hypothetical protein